MGPFILEHKDRELGSKLSGLHIQIHWSLILSVIKGIAFSKGGRK